MTNSNDALYKSVRESDDGVHEAIRSKRSNEENKKSKSKKAVTG